MMLHGCWTALVTPFQSNGALDSEGLALNLARQLRAGVAGVVALGTTGETATLTEHEQKLVVSAAVNTGLPVMVGTGTNCTKRAIDKTRWAEDNGAAYALVIAPYYNRPGQEGIYEHFMRIADAVEIPIVAYNHPGRTGVTIETATLEKMAVHERIIGLKETAGDMMLVSDRLSRLPDVALLSGCDELTVPMMALGAIGVISVLSNLFPEKVVELVRSVDKRAMHFELLPWIQAAMAESNPIPIKAMMNHFGLAAGPCRLPLTTARQETVDKIRWLSETHTLHV